MVYDCCDASLDTEHSVPRPSQKDADEDDDVIASAASEENANEGVCDAFLDPAF